MIVNRALIRLQNIIMITFLYQEYRGIRYKIKKDSQNRDIGTIIVSKGGYTVEVSYDLNTSQLSIPKDILTDLLM